jgi:hypothetical protein
MTRTVVAFGKLTAKRAPRRGWSVDELERRRKADGEKLKIARRLRAETTMTWGWIADRLAMGTVGYVAETLRKDNEF